MFCRAVIRWKVNCIWQSNVDIVSEGLQVHWQCNRIRDCKHYTIYRMTRSDRVTRILTKVWRPYLRLVSLTYLCGIHTHLYQVLTYQNERFYTVKRYNFHLLFLLFVGRLFDFRRNRLRLPWLWSIVKPDKFHVHRLKRIQKQNSKTIILFLIFTPQINNKLIIA